MDWRNSDNNCQVPIPTFWWRGEKSYPKTTYSYPGEVIPINCCATFVLRAPQHVFGTADDD